MGLAPGCTGVLASDGGFGFSFFWGGGGQIGTNSGASSYFSAIAAGNQANVRIIAALQGVWGNPVIHLGTFPRLARTCG